jgi:predicted Fe-Mo cluster-binding NifX family protein
VQIIILKGEKMKIAIPLFGTRISPRLDCAKKIHLIKIEEKDHKIFSFEETDFQAGSTGENLEFYVDHQIAVVICGGISIEMHDLLVKNNIRVISWVTGEAHKALDLFLKDRLVSGAMLCPGVRVKRWRFCCQGRVKNIRHFKY